MNVRKVKRSRCNTRIVFVIDSQKLPLDLEGREGEIAVRYEGRETVIYAVPGLGNDSSNLAVRRVAATAMRAVNGLKRKTVALDIGPLPESLHAAAFEGAVLGTYVFDTFLRVKPGRVSGIDIVGSKLSTSAVEEIVTGCEGVFLARNLVNGNAGDITPEALARKARSIGRAGGMRVTVLTEAEIRRQGLGLLAAVGQGSPFPPRLILMEYSGAGKRDQHTAIVGKGITFDSGGQNLKPSGSIETMRCDMAGAAAVLGVMHVLATLRPAVNVIGVCAAAHNAVDGTAYFPGDVYRAYDGTTVEICNTDAEGRLVLADAVSYVRDRYKPGCIIDLATLTGGILTALGDVVAGLFSNDDDLAHALFNAGEQSGERLWRFPLYKEYSDALKGDRGDLRNISKFKRGYASSITGAAFVGHFAGEIPWAHLDIAGTAYNEGEIRGEIPKMGTGFGVRLLLEHLISRRPRRFV